MKWRPLSLVLLAVCCTSFGCTQRYAKAGYPARFYPFLAQYSPANDELDVSFSGGRYLPKNLHFRRYATSGGLALDPVSQPFWAKMDTWMYARVTGVAQLREPAAVSFEIWQYDRDRESDSFRQRIELQITPPPNVSVTFNGRTVNSGRYSSSQPSPMMPTGTP